MSTVDMLIRKFNELLLNEYWNELEVMREEDPDYPLIFGKGYDYSREKYYVVQDVIVYRMTDKDIERIRDYWYRAFKEVFSDNYTRLFMDSVLQDYYDLEDYYNDIHYFKCLLEENEIRGAEVYYYSDKKALAIMKVLYSDKR